MVQKKKTGVMTDSNKRF